jgi:hypothetical protein
MPYNKSTTYMEFDRENLNNPEMVYDYFNQHLKNASVICEDLLKEVDTSGIDREYREIWIKNQLINFLNDNKDFVEGFLNFIIRKSHKVKKNEEPLDQLSEADKYALNLFSDVCNELINVCEAEINRQKETELKEKNEEHTPIYFLNLYEEGIIKFFNNDYYRHQIMFIKDLCLTDNINITVGSNLNKGKIETFNNTNKHHLLGLIQEEIFFAKIDESLKKLQFSLTIRQFTKFIHKDDLHEQRVGQVIIREDGIYFISQKDCTEFCTTCPETGKNIGKEKAVTYIGFDKMIKILGLNLEKYKAF